MRLSRPRFTVRRMMVAVAIAGLICWLGGTALSVLQVPGENITHLMQDRATGELSLEGHSLPPSFWPHYRRALLGQAWPGDYPCQCRLNPDPGRRELASSANSNDLLPLVNRVSGPSRKANAHRASMESLASSVAYDEKRVIDLDRQVKELASKGRILHGADGVRAALLNGIAENRKRLREHERLFRLYDFAARSPTLLTDPEVVEPDPPEQE
jgi:hypothetical protein